MPLRKTYSRVLCALLAAAFFSASGVSSYAASSSAGRDKVARKLERLQDAQRRTAETEENLARASKRLDDILREQDRTRTHLGSRATAMYRAGEITFLSMLFGATTFEDFATRWQLLTRMNQRDADALERLEVLRVRARKSTLGLMRLQEEAARARDTAAREFAAARKEFAANQAAQARLREMEAAKNSAAADSAMAAPPTPSYSRLTGKGPWKTAVASHYGRDFSGRGASGTRIGPYSMMCAHKRLPFGTLVEFEYNGKRAVASVQDRGPFTAGREFDLGPGIVRTLDFEGVHEVRYRLIER